MPSPPSDLDAAEAVFLARRRAAVAVLSAAETAMQCALGAAAQPVLRAAARPLAAAVEAHGRSFAPGPEPAYHDRYHQAEAALAMGWLCGLAREAGLLGAEAAGLGVLAMIGHDLRHDGGGGGPPGRLEARSAAETAAILAECGLGPAGVQVVRAVILATDPAAPPPAALLPRLAREADVMGSLTKRLGWRLSQALAEERRAEGRADWAVAGSFAGRCAFLRMQPPPSPAAAAFGYAEALQDQIAAFALAAARLGASPHEDPAAVLDARPRAEAEAQFAAALAAGKGLPA